METAINEEKDEVLHSSLQCDVQVDPQISGIAIWDPQKEDRVRVVNAQEALHSLGIVEHKLFLCTQVFCVSFSVSFTSQKKRKEIFFFFYLKIV